MADRLAIRTAGSRGLDAGGLHAAAWEGRHLPDLRRADPAGGAALCQSARVQPGQFQGRPSREHQDRSDAVFAALGRQRAWSRLRGRRKPRSDISRRTFHGMDARPVSARVAAGHGVAPGSRRRSGRGNAPDADRQTGDGAVQRCAVFYRRAAGTVSLHVTARTAGSRHSSRRSELHQRGSVRAACRCASARSPAPRALPRARGSRLRHAAGRFDSRARLHQGLGLSLAGRVQLPDADRIAEGHDTGDALRVPTTLPAILTIPITLRDG